MDEIAEQIDRCEFFQDFINYLKYLEKQPITKTAKGNISRKDIEGLSSILECIRKTKEEFAEFKWALVGDWQLPKLLKIKVMAEIMYLVYNRKGMIYLSKNGQSYLHKIGSLVQLENLVFDYWERVSWSYFEYFYKVVKNKSLLEILQDQQNVIWRGLWENGEDWIEFEDFAKQIEEFFGVAEFFKADERLGKKYDYMDLEYGLVRNNLELFGLVETEGKTIYRDHKQLERLRPTKLGLYMFEKAVKGRYFNMV